jgi:hypothetical protein
MDWSKDESGLSIRDIETKQPYKLEPHSFAPVKKIAWLRCKHCGLLTLKNELTSWCVKMGCNANNHPEYASRCRNAKPR